MTLAAFTPRYQFTYLRQRMTATFAGAYFGHRLTWGSTVASSVGSPTVPQPLRTGAALSQNPDRPSGFRGMAADGRPPRRAAAPARTSTRAPWAQLSLADPSEPPPPAGELPLLQMPAPACSGRRPGHAPHAAHIWPLRVRRVQ